MLTPIFKTDGGNAPGDQSVAATRTFVENHGASLLRVMKLTAGKAGSDEALRLINVVRGPVEPQRQDLLRAVSGLRFTLEEAPINVEPQFVEAAETNRADLDAAVCWYLSRMCDLAARLS